MVSKRARLKAAAQRARESSLPNKIIDGITISFGVQNMLPSTIASSGSLMTRAKTAVNELLGRTTGLNLFPDAPQFVRHFDIENALTNPQTLAGLAATVYGEVAKRFKILPLKVEARRFAKKNIAVGIATGLFGEKGALSTSGTDIQTHITQIGHGAPPVVGAG